MERIENQTFDMERALYGSHEISVKNCSFDGPADGESALKESSDINVEHCFCNLRYPFWHDHRLKITDSEMTPLCRAALWYSDHIEITGTKLHGIKALRECRYSFGIFDVNTILNESEEDLKKIADGFYNDTYLMDQNACSTPHMIFWRSNGSTADFLKVQERFWKAVNSSAKKYDLADIKVSDKYVALCKAAIDLKADFEVTTYDNLLYVLSLKNAPAQIEQLRGKYGMFYQWEIHDLEEICPLITNTVQTCVVHGINKENIGRMIVKNNLTGIDRIVPVGHSLDIGVIWDGYDLIRQFTRIVHTF